MSRPHPDPVWIAKFTGPHTGIRVAVKDILALDGTITTAACKAFAQRSSPATTDAQCLWGLRAAVARGKASIVGKTNLNELAFGADGINTEYGSPLNPLDATRICGGSSSGSAVAVATGQADVAIGTDTGGSIRIPAACCGIVGLKTTWGRIPTGGCHDLAPFLDTIGPLARTVADVIVGMDLLETGFAREVQRASTVLHRRIGRIVHHWVPIDTAVQDAVDALLGRYADEAGCEIVDVELPGWETAHNAGLAVLLGEAWHTNKHLLEGRGVTDETTARLRLGRDVTDAQLTQARAHRSVITAELQTLVETHNLDVLATPTMPVLPPTFTDNGNASLTALTRLANIAGTPALSIPAPRNGGHLPASLQFLGLPGSDATLCALAALLN
jgi:amidase